MVLRISLKITESWHRCLKVEMLYVGDPEYATLDCVKYAKGVQCSSSSYVSRNLIGTSVSDSLMVTGRP